jgi:hypothetical protein
MIFAGATLGFEVAFGFYNIDQPIFPTGWAEEIHR